MLILLLYTAIGLFTGIADSQSGDVVDTIIRTSSALIFGYFISTNFTKINTTNSPADSYSSNLSIPAQTNDENLSVPLSNGDEFAASDNDAEEQIKTSVTEFSPDKVSCSKLQVIIVSQLRDFVSASIGFIISCGLAK